MPLTFTAISYRGHPPTDHITAVLTHRTGTIGRAPDNDLVLTDPEKFVSRFHASIHYEKGSFYITDTSLAGTSIINRGITLNRNTHQETARLENGDHLQVGDYELTVSVSEEHELAPPLPDVYSVLEPLASASPLGPDTTQDNLDLENLLNSGKSSPPDISSESNINQSAHPHAVDYLRGPAHQESFTPPKTVSSPTPPVTKQEMIPDDFNLQDLLNSLEKPDDQHQPNDFPDIPPPPVENIPKASGSNSIEEPPPLAPNPPGSIPRTPETRPVVTQTVPAQAAPTPERPPDDEMRVPPSPTPPPADDTNREHAQDELVTLFLEAAGIGAHPSMHSQEIVELMQVAGTLIREITGGLMTMLRGRMEIKNQFRVSRTIIRPTGNNPLKFSLTPEDALKLLLVEKKPGFLKAVEAVQQACNDIMNHELASTAANQASILAILKQFDPHNFSQQYEEGFILQKKSKCWENYCQAYPEVTKKAQENFFGEEFANAYEEQMQKLQSMNRANQQKLRDKHHE